MPYPYTLADAEALRRPRRATPTRSARSMFAIDLAGRGAGRAAWDSTPHGVPGPEVGYWLGRPSGAGASPTEALAAVMAWARDGWGRRCVVACHFADNPASGAGPDQRRLPLHRPRSSPGPAGARRGRGLRAGWSGWRRIPRERGTLWRRDIASPSTSALRRAPPYIRGSHIVRWRWMALTSGGSERAGRFFVDRKAKLARQDRRRPEAAGAARPRGRGGRLRDRAPAADGRRSRAAAADHGRAPTTAPCWSRTARALSRAVSEVLDAADPITRRIHAGGLQPRHRPAADPAEGLRRPTRATRPASSSTGWPRTASGSRACWPASRATRWPSTWRARTRPPWCPSPGSATPSWSSPIN